MERYTNKGPVICDEDFDTSIVKGKSAIVTGGANGIGEQYVKSLVKAGAYVTFGDIDEKGGKQLESELGRSAKFVRCDVLNWDEQLSMFKDALANSPSKRIDIVCANAGVAIPDSAFSTDPQQEHPDKPSLKVLEINSGAQVYTIKLALHYFRRQFAQNSEGSKDQLLVLQASVAGYLDIPTSLQYNMSKFGMRSAMRTLRWTEAQYGIRVNSINPWFIKTALVTPEGWAFLESQGLEYAAVQDVSLGMMKLASDPSINGRAFAILPRSAVKSGYADMDTDDYREGDFMRVWDDAIAKVTARDHRQARHV